MLVIGFEIIPLVGSQDHLFVLSLADLAKSGEDTQKYVSQAEGKEGRSPASNLMWLKEEMYLVSVMFLHPLMTLLSMSSIL
ncbi:hypothetical protein MC885_021735 [Smutsia gigantea]|nr:hypothetical protein MC885_021735 [Smutsia gigantea]